MFNSIRAFFIVYIYTIELVSMHPGLKRTGYRSDLQFGQPYPNTSSEQPQVGKQQFQQNKGSSRANTSRNYEEPEDTTPANTVTPVTAFSSRVITNSSIAQSSWCRLRTADCHDSGVMQLPWQTGLWHQTSHVTVIAVQSNGHTTSMLLTNSCVLYPDLASVERVRRVFLENFAPSDAVEVVMYIDVTIPNFTYPSSSEVKNKLLQWQWVKQNRFYFVQYPVDLDIITLSLLKSAYKDNSITINILNPELCDDWNFLENQIADFLWREVFRNKSQSYLCNRDFSTDRLIKEILFHVTMVWEGYDLTCSFFQDKTKIISKKERGPVIITYICLILALFYPLLFKFIELRYITDKLEKLNTKDDKKSSNPNITENPNNSELKAQEKKSLNENIDTDTKLRNYERNDVPFGFSRFMLKLFFIIKVEHGDYDKDVNFVRNIAATRLVSIFFLILGGYLIYPFINSVLDVQYKLHQDVYRFGLPIKVIRAKPCINGPLLLTLLLLSCMLQKSCYVLMYRDKHLRKDAFIIPYEVINCELLPVSSLVEEKKPFFIAAFIDRFISMISSGYWERTWNSFKTETFHCCCCKCLCCFIVNIPLYITMNVLNIIMSIIPSLWITLFSSVICSKVIADKCHSFGKWCMCCQKALYVFLFPLVFAIIAFSQWSIVCAFTYVLRSGFYLVFVVSSSSSNGLRDLAVILMTLAYVASFYAAFLGDYKDILDGIFDIKDNLKSDTESENEATREGISSNSMCSTSDTPSANSQPLKRSNNMPTNNDDGKAEVIPENDASEDMIKTIRIRSANKKSTINQNDDKNTLPIETNASCFVSEKEYDSIIDHFFHIRQRVFWAVIKTLICLGFFIVTTTVLFTNHNFSDSKTDNLIKIAFVALSPKLIIDCFSAKTNHVRDILKKNKKKIEEMIKDIRNKERTENKRCCKCSDHCCRNCSCSEIRCKRCPKFCRVVIFCPILSTYSCCKCVCDVERNQILNGDEKKLCCPHPCPLEIQSEAIPILEKNLVV